MGAGQTKPNGCSELGRVARLDHGTLEDELDGVCSWVELEALVLGPEVAEDHGYFDLFALDTVAWIIVVFLLLGLAVDFGAFRSWLGGRDELRQATVREFHLHGGLVNLIT